MFSKMFTSKRKHESDAATIRVTGWVCEKIAQNVAQWISLWKKSPKM
jgi:hypothetical protein